jgi:two-component sensor histidine kinase
VSFCARRGSSVLSSSRRRSPKTDAGPRSTWCAADEVRLAAEAVEDRIPQPLREKEALLQEVHHRVKNNFQVISSLTSMQARSLEGATSRDVLLEYQTRVQAIALINEKL